MLVVDDDAAIRQIYAEILAREGYRVTAARDCADALARMEALAGNAEVLIIDLGLPDGDGADFARESARRYGPRPTMYVSGWTDEFWQLEDVPGRWLIMRKPVSVQKLVAGVRWLLTGGEKPAVLDTPD